MRLLSFLLFVVPAWAQPPASVTLDDVLRLVARSPRVLAAERDADMVRAERVTAGALPNPTLSFGSSRPSGGERTMFDANSQQQATIEMPIPIFGQRGARMDAADRQIGRAESQVRLTASEARRAAALGFARLLRAQETLGTRSAALGEIERIRGLVSGRQQSGVASRYDRSRVDAEAALAALAVQRAEADVAEQATAIAALVDAPGWRPRASGSLDALGSTQGAETDVRRMLAGNPTARLARDESAAAEARIELARRERYPVPSLAYSRSWTSGPYGAANYIGLQSEIPILDSRKGLEDRARADAAATRERERAANAALSAEYEKQRDTLRARREALRRFEGEVPGDQSAFLEMAESAYRLGRGTLFELLDARRTRMEASIARLELLGAIVEAEIELRALTGEL
ncbi:MAG: outer membrane protein heavy metal efflux system [Betaproteobacteria bacterium]|jgi:cobalt-zinc-cadmium efflux system outer membrane protein|nr:outer membrane protein heavy metal efflux system [Betaproteobacteria bacterium]